MFLTVFLPFDYADINDYLKNVFIIEYTDYAVVKDCY